MAGETGCKVLVLGHGTLPEDMVRAAHMVYGEVEGVLAIPLPADANMETYRGSIRQVMEAAGEEGLLVLTDFLGGTPFLTASALLREYWETGIQLVTGLNMPMLTEVFSSVDCCGAAELRDIALEAGTAGILDFRAEMQKKRTGE